MVSNNNVTMNDLLNSDNVKEINVGDLISGTVLNVKKNEILIDLGPNGVGYVPRRELDYSKKVNVGDRVTASVVETELDNGYSLLSLRKAAKDRGWDVLKDKIENNESITVVPFDANRGGLLVEYEGVRGFLPVSQLSAEHYPRISSNDKDEILQRLNSLVGKKLQVRILDSDKKTNKLILSEKEAVKLGLSKRFENIKVGDTVKGVVTGVVDYGAFVNVDGIEGLVHISEISWERVDNTSDHIKIGQSIEAKVIAIDKDRLSLSMKQLLTDPWLKQVDEFKRGDKIDGTITRITPFGAFVQISPAVEALVHISELGKGDNIDPEKIFKLNERKSFIVLDKDIENRKISLSLADKKS